MEKYFNVQDSKVHAAIMGPTWVLSAPDVPHVGLMNLAIRGNMRTLSMVRVVGINIFYILNYFIFYWYKSYKILTGIIKSLC